MIRIRLTAALLASAPFVVSSQAAQKTPAQISSEIISSLPDNISNLITPLRVRTVTTDIVNSFSPYFVFSTAPGNPVLYQHWFDISSTPMTDRQWDGSQWVTTGTLNTSTHLFTPNLAPGQAVANLGFTPLNKAGDQLNGTFTFNPFLGGRQITIGSHGVASSTPDVAFYAQSDEEWTVTPGTFATLGSFVLNTGGAATGERSALNATWQGKGAFTANTNLVAAGFTSHLTGGTGSPFGINPVCWLDVNVLSTASCIGAEVDTVVDAPATAKIGMQIVDLSHTAQPFGTNVDAGLIFIKGSTATGYQHAISIGYDPVGQPGLFQGLGSSGDIISTGTTPLLADGFNLSNVANWTYAPILLAPGAKGIWWGAAHEGGSISSLAGSSGADIGITSHGVQYALAGHTFAAISDSAMVFDAATFTGANMSMTIGGAFKASGTVTANATTASTSTTTGAIVDNGGLGVAGDVYIGASLNTVGVTNTPAISMGTSAGTAGSVNKIALYGALNASAYGFGVSPGSLDAAATSGSVFSYWVGGSKVATISGAAGGTKFASLDSTPIGATTPSTGAFSALSTALATPASPTASCSAGAMSFDTTYAYFCTAANTWKRVSMSLYSASGPVLSGAGTSPTLATGSDDSHGTVTEGTTATGFTLTFSVATTNPRDCVISSPGATAFTGYTVSTTALVLTNASGSGQKFSYVCSGR